MIEEDEVGEKVGAELEAFSAEDRLDVPLYWVQHLPFNVSFQFFCSAIFLHSPCSQFQTLAGL